MIIPISPTTLDTRASPPPVDRIPLSGPFPYHISPPAIHAGAPLIAGTTVSDRPTPARVAVYTGSFDPITLGHLDVIQRASRIFDRLVVGVGVNPDKHPLFTLDERARLVQASVAALPNVHVVPYDGLSVAFVRDQGAHVLLRGVRSLTDIDAEFTMTLANRKLDPHVETVFLMADAAYSHISSSLLKQITPLADDAALLRFVPPPVVAALREKVKPHP
ncbi:MAG: pantetheine-phosphate adenylyltransferase [Planctomycetia bacterium]|nr:pantetheine-phosphate adenylyltransferase [Planctomycetia bacterium]